MNRAITAALFGPMRLPFLILTPICVLLGVATSVWSGAQLNSLYLALAFLGGVAAHVSVNALNEYHDFQSGLDFTTQRTPFSGGSGTLPNTPGMGHIALITGLLSLTIVASIGVYFLLVRGLGLLPLGLVGVIVIVVYTKWITRNPFLCLIAPGLGFGPCMVMGTDFVLTGSYSWTSFVASLVPFFLVSNLLLLNQFPDVDADKGVGRSHYPIAIGRGASVRLYGVLLAGAYVSIVFGYLTGALPRGAFLGLATVIIAVPTVRGASRFANDIPKLIPYLGRNVLLNILTPLLLSIGLFVGG